MVTIENLFGRFRPNGKPGLQGKDYIDASIRENNSAAQILHHILDSDCPDIQVLQPLIDTYFAHGIHEGGRIRALALHNHAMKALPPEKYGHYARVLYWGGRSWDRGSWYQGVLDNLQDELQKSDTGCLEQFESTLRFGEVPIDVNSRTGRIIVTDFLFGDEGDIPVLHSNDVDIVE